MSQFMVSFSQKVFTISFILGTSLFDLKNAIPEFEQEDCIANLKCRTGKYF